MAIPYTPPTRSQVVDISADDHIFSFPGEPNARLLRFYTPTGTSSPAVVLRMLEDDDDLTVQLAEGVDYLACGVTAIRRTGTSAGIVITGFA